MDKTIMNAVVTLRNQVSPWLMILQVVPDGWELPDYVPGQMLAVDGGLLTGFGEDLRAVVRKRLETMKVGDNNQ